MSTARSYAATLRTLLVVQLFATTPAAAQSLPQWIRVAVVQNDPQVDLQIHGRFRMLALHTNDPIQEGYLMHRSLIRAVQEGLSVGDQLVPYPGVRIEPAHDAMISLNGVRLRGTLEIIRQQDLTLLVINHVALEDYLRGVLSREVPDYWPRQALRAMAITARTYAIFQRLTKAQSDYDVTGDILSQLYGGKTAEKLATNRAVATTEGLILTYEGKLFPAFYHSTCGGVTEHARVMGPFDIDPLQGGIICRLCSGSPFYSWTRRITQADVAWALRQSPHGSVGQVKDLQVSQRTPTGRVAQVAVVGSRGGLTLTGYDFRALFGFERIRSLRFAITPEGEAFVLQGQGWGHGVGMCQWGEAELARRGFSAEEILAFYYPNATVVHVKTLGQPPTIIEKGAL